ncbi:hypothetical protein K435DRAFT_783106 [Dendrothele bispora CBS 962.96]|uniref:Uncharacterized protein n=1 Tax=Dendrothele bispora (strain CBS 962.96) TaxID=1314807 RepID=A0A4V4HD56_DENBC|nr:hypothetical protein K435DRAFT_783106 [Dendrothele bispora CBS 962.96]
MSRVSKILWLLIESGLIYCFGLIAYIITIQIGFNPNDIQNTSLFVQIFVGITPLFAALFPVFVILMVALEDAKDSELDLSDSNNHKLSNSKNNRNISRSLPHSVRFASRNS